MTPSRKSHVYRCEIAVFGAGPAGLMAAQAASEQGAQVTVFEAGPAAGRKFLVAGRGGLNLSNRAEPGVFAASFRGQSHQWWRSVMARFDLDALCAWCRDLGSETFVGTSDRIFPVEKRSAKLLRAWLHRLEGANVDFQYHARWLGFDGASHRVLEREGRVARVNCGAAVLAFGGGSWPVTGSNAEWVGSLEAEGIPVTPLAPANCGWEVHWLPEFLAEAEGLPLKNVTVTCGTTTVAGECLVTRYGLEGGPIYRLGPELRRMANPTIRIDLKPTLSVEAIEQRWIGLGTFEQRVRALRLSQCAIALLKRVPSRLGQREGEFASLVKSLPINLVAPRPLAEAISSAGGVAWSAVSDELMIVSHPGVFVAGEMLDWEAPTGGYLLHGCLALGRVAGVAAAGWSRSSTIRSGFSR